MYPEIRKRPELWDLFIKKEEYTSKKLDEHDRFEYQTSVHKDVLIPKVSNFLTKKGFKIKYPHNKEFAIVLTHDVDDIFVKNRHIFLSLINLPKNKEIQNVYQLIKGRINKQNTPYKNFKNIINIEKKYNAKSSFYFFAESKDIFGTKYNLNDVEDDLNYLLKNDCEIGLHTSYYSYDSAEKIIVEKEKLENIIGKEILGCRNHVLRFKTPDSWHVLSKAGLSYDTSYGYHDMIGFRNGMAHPFRPYDIKKDKEINILEIPLIIQDMTFLMYYKIKEEQRWKYIKNLIDSVKKCNGVLTVLWHNWTFTLPASYGGLFNKQWTSLYEKILEYGLKNNALLTNCEEIYKLYKDQI